MILFVLLQPRELAGQSMVPGIDQTVEAAMKEWQIPGLALAVVKDGRVAHLRGYGYRDVERKLPVTPTTLFGIGSITKSFTVLLLSTLAEEGKLDWDKPVRDYVPDFRLHDPAASALTTAVDLVSHRTGLPRHDSMWFTGFTRNEIFGRLRHLEASRDFRSTFQYNNLLYMAAGVVAERAAGGGGRTWEDLVRERLFEPVGMPTANFSVTASERSGDWSLNYALDKDETLKPIPATYAVESICPAGCINASLEEMSRYLQFHLARGLTGGGQRVLAASHFDRMREPRIFIPAGSFGPERLGPGFYGMGVAVMTYRGHRLVFHTGTIGGYHALLAFLPEDNAGVVILQNRVARAVPQLLSWTVWDRLLGLEDGGWLAKFAEDEKAAKAKTEAARRAVEAKRQSGTALSHPLAAYAGTYRHAAYGEVKVEEHEGALRFRFGPRVRPLEHFHYDVFRYDSEPPMQRLRFLTNVDGEVDQLAARMEPAVPEIVFTRVAAK